MAEDGSNVYGDIRSIKLGTCRQIKVSNFSDTCTDEVLSLLFESKKIFGRCLNVEKVDLNKGAGFAVVTFQTSEDARTVMEVHRDMPCTEHGRELDIELYLESNADSVEDTKTIQVQDYNAKTSKDTFRYYFENPRKSGGGPIQSLTVIEDNEYVLITFMDAEVVEKVLSREHMLDGHKLQVNKFIVSKTEILFSDLPVDTSTDTITNFCEAKLEKDVVSATFSEDKSKVLVRFKEAVDFRLAEKHCKRCSVNECFMTPHQVSVTRAVIVTDIDPDSTRDDFWFYFENRHKSSGGEVLDVILKPMDGYCLVFFKDPKVVQSVCSQLEHMVRGSLLKVEPFNSSLGQPVQFTFPDPVFMDTLDPYKLKFLETHDKYKGEMTKTLAEKYASVSWERPFPKVECTVTSSVKDYKAIARSWNENVQKVFDDFAYTVEVTDFSFEFDELTDVKKELHALNIDHPEQVVVKVDTKNNKVVLIALKHCIGSLLVQVKQAIDKAKESLRQRKDRKTEKKQFKPWNIRYLKAIGFTGEMAQQFKQAEIQLNEETCEVTITATQREIQDILLEVHSVIEQVSTQKLELEKGHIELLSNKATREKVNVEMRNKGISDVWEVEGQKVLLYAEDNDNLMRMKNVIEKMLTKISVDVDKKQRDLLSSKQWNELKTKLSGEFQGCVVIRMNDDKLEIYTTPENGDSIDQQVKGFFSKNTTYKKEIPLDATRMKFIETYMKNDMDLEMRSLSKTGKPLMYKLHSSKVTIKGTADELKAAQAVVKKLEEKIICKPHNLKKRGVYRYISSQKGKEAINNIQRGTLVIIDVKGKGLGSSLGKGKKNMAELNISTPSHCAECVLKSGHKVIVYGGDMTELAVDVIVNASNNDLKHAGGLATVIVKKGGSDIQQECENHIQQNGSLFVGDVFMSGAGKLKCKAVVHAVSPVWHDGKQDEEKNLILAVENCLRETEKKQYMSIALPALSSGMFGYPVDKACLVITKTVKSYFKNKNYSIIGKVYLCDINKRTTQSFVEAARITFHQCKILADIGSTDNTVKKHAWLTESSSLNDEKSKPKTAAKLNPVKVIKGEITREKVDVIVNSTSSDLQLDKGKASQAILEAGGRIIQEDCCNNYPSGISTGQIALTRGGRLQCRQVFHVALEPYKKAQHMHPIQGLKKSMEACLREADKQGYTSIAFPAMGTGAQGYPKDKVANEMFRCAADYFKRNRNSGLTKVHFVILHKDDKLYETFITEEQHWAGQDHTGNILRVNSLAHGKIVTAKRSYGEFEFGSVKVKVFKGDITEQKTDAIVASSNHDLDLSKGEVTKAIVKKGGQEIVQDCEKQKREMQKHGVTVTVACQLQARYIIHVDTKYNLKEWEPMILKCLNIAEKHTFSSVAFPVLGTSVGCKPDDIARLFSSAFTSFHQQSPKHLQRVSIVVFNQEMLSPFIDGMKSSISAGPSRQGSFRGLHKRHSGQHEVLLNRQSKPEDMDDVCSLNIYGIDDGRIDRAVRQLETDVKQNWMISHVPCKMLNELGGSRVKKIQECGKKNHVIVDFEETRGNIDLTGLPANIITVSEQISAIIRDFDNSQYNKKMAKLMKNIIKWFYIKDNKSFPFPDAENLKIETAYSEKKATVRIKDKSGGEYEINFNDMKEWDVSQPSVKFPVIRKDLMKDVGHETPKEWAVMRENQQLLILTLQPSSKEYQTVEQHFVSTLGRQPQIAKIVRIQNVTLYRQYAAKKKQMESSNPKQKNEQMLWHGTDVSALDSINNHGFNRSYCGKNGGTCVPKCEQGHRTKYSDECIEDPETTSRSQNPQSTHSNAKAPYTSQSTSPSETVITTDLSSTIQIGTTDKADSDSNTWKAAFIITLVMVLFAVIAGGNPGRRGEIDRNNALPGERNELAGLGEEGPVPRRQGQGSRNDALEEQAGGNRGRQGQDDENNAEPEELAGLREAGGNRGRQGQDDENNAEPEERIELAGLREAGGNRGRQGQDDENNAEPEELAGLREAGGNRGREGQDDENNAYPEERIELAGLREAGGNRGRQGQDDENNAEPEERIELAGLREEGPVPRRQGQDDRNDALEVQGHVPCRHGQDDRNDALEVQAGGNRGREGQDDENNAEPEERIELAGLREGRTSIETVLNLRKIKTVNLNYYGNKYQTKDEYQRVGSEPTKPLRNQLAEIENEMSKVSDVERELSGAQLDDLAVTVLRKCFTRLLDDLDSMETGDYLYQLEVISRRTNQDFSEMRHTKRCRNILDCVARERFKGYKVFTAIIKVTNPQLFEHLKKCETENVTTIKEET